MAASINDKLRKTAPAFSTTLASQKAAAAATMTLSSATGVPTDTAIDFTVGRVDSAGTRTPTTKAVYKGTLAGTTVSNLTLVEGTDQLHAAGTVVEITWTSKTWTDAVDHILTQHNQDGTHGAVTATSLSVSGTTVLTGAVTLPAATVTAAKLSTELQKGWEDSYGSTTVPAPNTVTCNGNRSYDLVFNGVDLTSSLSAGMRLKLTRTVTAPTQCTSLNGTTQYYSRASASVGAMTFTDDFTVSAWVKLSSYANGAVASRFNGTSGWEFTVINTGQVLLRGYNAGGANLSQVLSYQSVPLNRWVHIAAQLDMSAFTATTTTSYVMIDGVDVPAAVTRGGTNPTALVQAGDFNVGSYNAGAGNFFPGKIAQVAVYSAKVTQANIRATVSQGITGSETSLLVGYSFNGVVTDLSANGYTLTANGSAVATNADSPFGQQADGTTAGTTDYGIITKTAFSTNTTLTVQVPEGCAIPTTGGVSAVSYSTQKSPYGFVTDASRWRISSLLKTDSSSTSNATYGSFIAGGWQLVAPVGSWNLGWQAYMQANAALTGYFNLSSTALTGLSVAAGANTSPYTTAFGSATAGYGYKSFTVLPQNLTSSQTFVMYTFGATTSMVIYGTVANAEIFADFAYL